MNKWTWLLIIILLVVGGYYLFTVYGNKIPNRTTSATSTVTCNGRIIDAINNGRVIQIQECN